jgi:methylisocitrate lyase
MRGKQVIDRHEYIQKIKAASEARAGRDFFIVARTDALAVAGLDEALARMEAARQAGADASFVEAPGSVDHLNQIGRRAPKPIVANMIEGGKTPLLPRAELEEMGFQMILYPLAGLYAAAQAIEFICRKLDRDQTTRGAEEHLMCFDRFNELIGVEAKYAVSKRFEVED